MRLASIDIGSNAVRLFIGNVKEDHARLSIQRISHIRVPVRPGADTFSEGHISAERIEKLARTLEAFQALMEVHEVEGYKACATSAIREADNEEEVLRTVRERSGIEVESISGQQESALIYNSFQKRFEKREENILYIDVGGGSTELTLFRGDAMIDTTSLPIGTVRMKESGIPDDEWAGMRQWIDKLPDYNDPLIALGTGGNIDELFKLSGQKRKVPLPYRKLKELTEKLDNMTLQERIEEYGLRPDRAEVIVPAATICMRIMDAAGIDRLLVPKVGLVHGIVTELYLERKGETDHAPTSA